MKLVSLNWRGQAARWHAYFREGLTLHNEIKQIVYVGAALKILGLSIYWLAVLTPPLIVYLMLSGYWFVRHGWKRHSSEITLIDKWEPIEIFKIHGWVKLMEKHGIDPTDYDPHTLPAPLMKKLASTNGQAWAHQQDVIWLPCLVTATASRGH